MLKIKRLEKGILWISNQFKGYQKLRVEDKINFKSEIAYYWNHYLDDFHKHIKPIFQKFDKKAEDFLFQEYFFSREL